jgi:hypothetical protein
MRRWKWRLINISYKGALLPRSVVKLLDGGAMEEQWIIHLIYGETGMYGKSFDTLEK